MISLPMSSVSSVCGLNPYKHIGAQTVFILERYNSGRPITYADAKDWPLLKAFDEKYADFMNLYMTAPCIAHLEEEGQRIIRSLCEEHGLSYDANKYLLIKRRGYIFEKNIVRLYEEMSDQTVQPVKQKMIYLDKQFRIFHDKIEDPVLRIVGKADGQTTKHICEVKCRKKGFRTAFHETIQIAIYAIAYKKDAILIQYSEGKIQTRTLSHAAAMELWDTQLKPLLIRWVAFAKIMKEP